MASLCVNNDILAVFCGSSSYVTSFQQLQSFHLFHCHNSTNDKNLLTQENSVKFCSALSNNGKYYAVVMDNDKLLLLWQISPLLLLSKRKIKRRCSRVIFSPSDQDIIISDKSGDVYSFSVKIPEDEGKLLLGHLSMILDVVVTPDEKFILTCDRDEKIRVSHYPNSYNIASFCLGHNSFVSSIIVLANNTLMSASADGSLRFWDYLNGTQLACYDISKDVLTNDKPDLCNLIVVTKILTHCSNQVNFIIVMMHKIETINIYAVCEGFSLNLTQCLSLPSYPLDGAIGNDQKLWVLRSDFIVDVFKWDEKQRLFISCSVEEDDITKTIPSLDNLCCHLKDIPTLYDQLIMAKHKQAVYQFK